MRRVSPLFFSLLLFLAAPALAEDLLRPYLLIDNPDGSLAETALATRSTLGHSDFELLGEYSPYPGALVMVITHPALLETASKTEFGGYAAALRLGLTEVDGKVQRAYANPRYWGTALHVGSLAPVGEALQALFGAGTPFGSKKGLGEKKLSKYRYMMMMPRLRDHEHLASFDNHEAAISTIRRNLVANDKQLTPVFEVAIPDSAEVLFGVGIGSGDGADSTVMAITDSGDLRHTAHLPYAVLVSGKDVYTLAGKFRIALAFPDLGMGTFMKISSAPNAIRDTLGSLTAPAQE